MKSSRQRGGQILGVLSPKRAERLLTFLANSPEDVKYRNDDQGRAALDGIYPQFDKIRTDFPDIFSELQSPFLIETAIYAYTVRGEPLNLAKFVDGRTENIATIWGLATKLRRAWQAPNSRAREWFLFKLRQDYQHAVKFGDYLKSCQTMQDAPKTRTEFIQRAYMEVESVPAVTPFEAAVYHLQCLGDRARICPNPECPAPYFIATKKGQKYCSPECAAPSQRESKRKWWHTNRAKGGA